MTSYIRWLWAKLNSNYWFYPALFAITGLLLAFWMVWLDRNGFADSLTEFAWLIPARPTGASNMLTVIAGSMIGVASTVFSITIAAVAYASGTYGPRLLTNFMQDKGNQLSLATFIGTFVYALTVLRSVRAEDEIPANAVDAAASALPGFVPQLSLLVGMGLMALSVAVLVFFLNHIPASIRINSVLEGIGRRLIKDVGEAYPDLNRGEDAEELPGGQAVLATHSGYVQIINFEGLVDTARETGTRIAMEVRTGDFVHPGMAMARVCGNDACSAEDLEKLSDAVRTEMTLGAIRTPEQDPQFLIDELVEIALRALSPGINDPFTAITSMHWLGTATAYLGTRDLRKHIAGSDGDGPSPIVPLPDNFEHYLSRGFGNVRTAVATSPTAALVMFDTLRNAAAPIDDEARVMLLTREGDRLMEQAKEHLSGPNLQQVEARYQQFRDAMPS